jgi:mannose-6-phosphate isomerase-like protein (cupin superfamily)
MDPFVLTVPAGGGRSRSLAHEGEEFLRVLSGKVQFHYGEGVHELAAGDSLSFDAATPHRLVNPGSTDGQVLCVFHGRGQPLMTKLRKRRKPAAC